MWRWERRRKRSGKGGERKEAREMDNLEKEGSENNVVLKGFEHEEHRRKYE